jgi:hypothetical protein
MVNVVIVVDVTEVETGKLRDDVSPCNDLVFTSMSYEPQIWSTDNCDTLIDRLV